MYFCQRYWPNFLAKLAVKALQGPGNTVPDVQAELVGQRGAVDKWCGHPGRHAVAPEPGPLVGRRLCAAGQRVQVQVAGQGHQLSAEFIATELYIDNYSAADPKQKFRIRFRIRP